MENKIDINNMTEEELDALMANVLAGDYTQEEYDALSAWIAADASHAEEFRQVKSFWNAEVSDRFYIDANKELGKLMKRVNKTAKKTRVFNFRNLWITAAVAASLFIGILVGWNFTKSEVILSKTYAFMTGESISTFTLPDGSTVHLNKDSRLEYTGNFGKGNRKVHLVGEGYFDVKHMDDCRFIVDLDGANITVKGTSFNAVNHPETGIKGAALVSGSVEFQSESQYLQLTPKRQVLYDSHSNELTISAFDPSIVTAWKDRLFRYKSLSVSELTDQLMEEYDINIVIAEGDFGEERYSGALDLGLPAASVMDLFSMQTNSSWSKRNDIYYISKD